jgi:hypothetical protein
MLLARVGKFPVHMKQMQAAYRATRRSSSSGYADRKEVPPGMVGELKRPRSRESALRA